MKYWTTQDGKELKVKAMTNYHIENCINYLQRKLDKGEIIVIWVYGGSDSWDGEDMWYDEEEVDVTEEIKNWIKTFKKELKKRDYNPLAEDYII